MQCEIQLFNEKYSNNLNFNISAYIYFYYLKEVLRWQVYTIFLFSYSE